jgi:hypothetical protein
MDMKVAFGVAVIVAVVVLVIVLGLQITTDITVPLTEGKISCFNLLVDVVTGVFTVWGLYWAASELALKPELDLDIGGADGTHVLQGKPVTRCNLYLTNARPKAARFIRIVLFVCNVPPIHFRARCIHHDGTDSMFYWHEDREGFQVYSVQYPENFVIYKGERVDAGWIELQWPNGGRPKEVRFRAELYSLESEPKAVEITLPIRWAGEVD